MKAVDGSAGKKPAPQHVAGAAKKPTGKPTGKPTKKATKPDPKPPKRPTPAPTDDDITPDVLEFIAAIDAYKRTHGRPFPNWSEILKIVKSLGYRRD
jgi:cell division septation protein DedD